MAHNHQVAGSTPAPAKDYKFVVFEIEYENGMTERVCVGPDDVTQLHNGGRIRAVQVET